jgi:hypothetical protein
LEEKRPAGQDGLGRRKKEPGLRYKGIFFLKKTRPFFKMAKEKD